MLTRVKTFEATGIAPNGRLYAGDLNAIEDAAAAQADFAQTIDLATLRIGASDVMLSRYGAAEAQFSGHLRAQGILRGLSGIIPGAFTTATRDAIAAGMAPYGMAILNSQTNQWEFNRGTDVARDWRPFGFDPALSIIFTGGASKVGFTNKTGLSTIITSQRVAEAQERFRIFEDGLIQIGGGVGAPDTSISRDAANRIKIVNDLNLGGYNIYFGNLAASMFVDGVASRIRGGTLSIQNSDGSIEYGFIGDDLYRFRSGRHAVQTAQGTKRLLQTGTTTANDVTDKTVVFPVAFSAPPVMQLTPPTASDVHLVSVSATQFTLNAHGPSSPMTIQWLAEGPVA